jgi:hypothetical protein
MAQKQYFLLVDTDTTIERTVADFGAVIVDRHGTIFKTISILVAGEYGTKKLFHDARSSEEIWTLKGLERRNENYQRMLNSGERTMGHPLAINKWIGQAQAAYPNLIMCAYNLAFDIDVMRNTGLTVDGFADNFCLWRASVNKVSKDKKYILHCLERKWLTAKLNLRTNAEAMAEYATGKELPPEPHTALEDVLYYELPILLWLVKNKSYKK